MKPESHNRGAVTLTTIARHAGVSKSTVSRILNDTECVVPISARTRKRVLDTARDLNYFPSALARALSRGTTKTIGVLGQDANFFAHSTHQQYTFTHQTLRYLLDSSVELGYHVTLLIGEEPDPASRVFDIGPVDGLLVVNRDIAESEGLMDVLSRFYQPVVYVFDYPDGPDVHYVAADNIQGGRFAAEVLLRRGHRRIGFVRDASFTRIFDRREDGVRQALRQQEIELPDDYCFRSVGEALSSLPGKDITALICANDSIAHELQRQLGNRGDIQILCFAHESAENPYSNETIPAVVQPIDTIMRAAVEHLVALIQGQTDTIMQKQFPFSYRQR